MEEKSRNFLAEAIELIESAYESIKRLNETVKKEKDPVNVVNEMFRIFHTIKGLAGMNNFQNLAKFTHEIENLLDYLRRGSDYSSIKKIGVVLFSSLDIFEEYFEKIKEFSKDEAIPNEQSNVLEEIKTLIEYLDKKNSEDDENEINSLPDKLISQLNDLEITRIKTNIKNKKYLFLVDLALSFETFDVDLKEIHKKLEEIGELIATLPGPDLADEEKISFTLLASASSKKSFGKIFPEEAIMRTIYEPIDETISKNVHKQEIKNENIDSNPKSLINVEKEDKEKKGFVKKRSGDFDFSKSVNDSSSAQESLRVFIEDLDNIVGGLEEFTIVKNNFESELKNLELSESDNAVVERLRIYAEKLGNHISSFQKQIINLRLIPLSNIFRRIESATVRTAKALNKDVRIVFKGGDTAVDKPITDKLIEPLIHLLRNSVDHGIESVEKRIKLGKDPVGSITFNAYQQGNSVFIDIRDDGKGIDITNVLKKAITKGFAPTTKDYTKQEIIDFIFNPGFSTAENVSEISGRGVGMDVVKNTINSIGGSIIMDSNLGKGTKALIQIPVTQAVVSLFLISSGDFLLGIPSFYVNNVEKFDEKKSKYVHNRMYYRLKEKTIPILNISLLLNTIDLNTEPSIIMVVNYLGQDYGLLVENVLEEKEVTVRPLSGKLKNIPLISGICEFSSKSVIYVMDVGDLIDSTGVKYV